MSRRSCKHGWKVKWTKTFEKTRTTKRWATDAAAGDATTTESKALSTSTYAALIDFILWNAESWCSFLKSKFQSPAKSISSFYRFFSFLLYSLTFLTFYMNYAGQLFTSLFLFFCFFAVCFLFFYIVVYYIVFWQIRLQIYNNCCKKTKRYFCQSSCLLLR